MSDRRLGLAVDFSPTSNYALKWALENILRDGDTLVLLMVIKKTDAENSVEHLWSAHGSPMIPFEEIKNADVMRRYNVPHVGDEAVALLTKFLRERRVTVCGKVYYGDARERLVNAIVELPIDALVMGSRGLGGFKKVVLGSVSDYVVNNSPCPVTVVKLPESPIR